MKTSLSSVDLKVLVRELGGMLEGARFDVAYSLEDGMLELRFHSSGVGSRNLVIAPGFLCVSAFKYPRAVENAGFVMSLRKHLNGLLVRSVTQHEFDRIVEFRLEGRGCVYLLVVELFSSGNVVLCDGSGVIVNLLSRQSWRDRTLTPKRVYSYPPAAVNPSELGLENFRRLLSESGRGVAAAVASLGLGGFYAEEICLNARVDKTRPAGGLGGEEVDLLFTGLRSLLDKAGHGTVEASIVFDGSGKPLDVVPFGFKSYGGNAGKSFISFNEAVDEYFSGLSAREINSRIDDGLNKTLGRLSLMRERQSEALARLSREAVEYQKAGDLIYQHLGAVDGLITQVRKARKTGLNDDEINSRLEEGRRRGIAEACLFRRVSRGKMALNLGVGRP